jgi:16S rRNA processing protein RimM
MIRIGKVVATHGLQGAVVFTHVVGRPGWLKKDDVLFLELNKGSFIPYFVQSAKAPDEEEYNVTLEDVERVEDAKKLIGKNVYVKEDIIAGYSKESPLLWIGFNIVDKTLGSLGQIEDVFQAGPQWLAKIDHEGKEVLIPLIDQMILDLNIRNKFIRMDLPEGLLDL